MDIDSFFSSQRWNILELLSKKPSSPLELSKELGTSVSYVSQQLKLLEAANFVSKQRTGIVDKGKPRTVFSVSRELLYLTSLTKGTPYRKLIHLTDYHRIILKIWFIDNPSLHYFIEKLYWKLEEDLTEVSGLYLDNLSHKPCVIIVSDSKKLRSRIEPFLKQHHSFFDSEFIGVEEMTKKKYVHLYTLYPPAQSLGGLL